MSRFTVPARLVGRHSQHAAVTDGRAGLTRRAARAQPLAPAGVAHSTPGTVDVGINGSGVINISGGTAVVNNVSLGSTVGGTGTGTLWMTSGQLTVTNGNLLVA